MRPLRKPPQTVLAHPSEEIGSKCPIALEARSRRSHGLRSNQPRDQIKSEFGKSQYPPPLVSTLEPSWQESNQGKVLSTTLGSQGEPGPGQMASLHGPVCLKSDRGAGFPVNAHMAG